jgi:hypothetical protein
MFVIKLKGQTLEVETIHPRRLRDLLDEGAEIYDKSKDRYITVLDMY